MRKDWDSYFMDIAFNVQERSTCPRLQVGSVIVKDKHLVSTGFNGSAPKLEHCEDVGCLMISGRCRRTIHSEVNAIINCSVEQRKGATIYVTAQPCIDCSKLIIASGITRVVFALEYPPDYDFFKDAPWIQVKHFA